jgi:hypothetical protein
VSMMVEIPPHITPAQVAQACGLTTRKAREKLRRLGILRKEPGGQCYVGDSRLREADGDLYDRVYAWFAERGRNGAMRSDTTGNAHAGAPTTE